MEVPKSSFIDDYCQQPIDMSTTGNNSIETITKTNGKSSSNKVYCSFVLYNYIKVYRLVFSYDFILSIERDVDERLNSVV